MLAAVCILSACKKFLDVKPDKKQVIPVSLEDCQALLNNVDILPIGPISGETSSDDYYLTDANWNLLIPQNKEPYIWQSNANVNITDWSGPYQKILVANQVLETLKDINRAANQQQWDKIKGAALLLRSINYFYLAELFGKPYDANTAGSDLGIPIRLTSSIDEETVRGNLQQVYDRMIQDFTEAATLLPSEQPLTPLAKSVASPVKATAYAGLARTFLIMGDYTKAYNNADASLKQYGALMDYKTLDPTAYYPIPRFNTEVIYEINGNGLAPLIYGLVAPELYNLYSPGDLRKGLYFRDNGNGTFSFKGTYVPGALFLGFATDEIYLIRAECAARRGNVAVAMDDLNTLRQNRWDNTYTPLVASNADEALKLIINERRRELPFRSLRWVDLRRLNKENSFAKILQRTLNGQVYSLPPNDIRYTLLIPREVLERVNIPQNPR
ncbi:SusD family protein [Pedobacter steynii]|uniref:SusD family protein n=1 Tax=Pedobacter steynii TaxID=430522 RepID=A0A1G9RFH1_9SPHI|nr:SusD family protein [Pedobacter steynii]